MTFQLLIGTQNPGKVREFRALLAEAPAEIVGLDEIGLAQLDVDETGTTFAENAILKARAYAQASGLYALADDSGLCVDALGGRPGVYSARYAGPGASDQDRRRKLLAELAGVPAAERGAAFEAVIAVVDPRTLESVSARGLCRGHIALEEADGPTGFGYDAIFIPDGHASTFAQMPKDQKNALSHRGRAAAALLPLLTDWLRTRGG